MKQVSRLCRLSPEELVVTASTVAIALSRQFSLDDLNILGNLFAAIGDSISIIAARLACSTDDASDSDSDSKSDAEDSEDDSSQSDSDTSKDDAVKEEKITPKMNRIRPGGGKIPAHPKPKP